MISIEAKNSVDLGEIKHPLAGIRAVSNRLLCSILRKSARRMGDARAPWRRDRSPVLKPRSPKLLGRVSSAFCRPRPCWPAAEFCSAKVLAQAVHLLGGLRRFDEQHIRPGFYIYSVGAIQGLRSIPSTAMASVRRHNDGVADHRAHRKRGLELADHLSGSKPRCFPAKWPQRFG